MRVDRELEAALRAAGAGARALRRRPSSAVAKDGDPVNLVTDRDIASQRAVFRVLRSAFPAHRLIGEEDPDALLEPPLGPTWTVDPLDGTSNFAHGQVPYGVSIGHAVDGRGMVGAIALPSSGTLAWAVRGRGAFARRFGRTRKLAVTETEQLDRAMVLTGYGYARAGYPAWLARFGRAIGTFQAVRMSGSAVADLVALASGAVDAVWEDEYYPWDFAAGALLVEEAGGQVSTLDGAALKHRQTSFLGSNGRLHHGLVRFLNGG